MTETPVIVSRQGTLGRLHLNRPRALNSLTLEMVRLLDAALSDFEADDSVASVLITGAGQRGLCAGGDIIALYEWGRAGDEAAARFWAEEYRLNARIADYSKPYIAFMDGITMGGGVGLSAYGSHRIVTDRTRLAMPETGIGLFPDVGATWLLSQAPGEIGTYLGLTGANCGATEAILAGFADYYMTADRLEALVAALAALPTGADATAVEIAIRGLCDVPPGSALDDASAEIDSAFAPDTIEGIMEGLEDRQSGICQDALIALRHKSPTSLKLSLALLRAARTSSGLRDCLNREYAAITSLLTGPDFYEGVRAAVIDKDRNPKWLPATLAEVPAPDLAKIFAGQVPLFNR